MELTGKTAVITGGNSGLGFEVAKELVNKQCHVIILGKDKTNIEEARLKINSDLVTTIVCDVKRQEQILEAAKQIKNPDILINCAGIIAYTPLEKQSAQNIRDIIETNLLGTIYMTQAMLIKMTERNIGTIINVSSTSGLPTGGNANEAVYIASKFGVSGFTEALKKEIDEKKKNIRVLGFYPGGMKTQLFAKSGYARDTANFMEPAEMAKIMVFILERPDIIKMDQVVINRNKNL